MIHREDFEILNQKHQMRAEGAQINEPNIEDIKSAVNNANYVAKNIEIWFDSLQSLWRWHSEISE